MARRIQNKPSVEDIRNKINASLGTKPLNEREWLLLVQKRYIDEIQHQGVPITDAVNYVREIRWSQEPLDEPQQRDDPKVISKEEAKAHLDRSFALSPILYEEATKDAGVKAFRSEVLDNTLLERDMVAEWIQQQAKVDGEANVWLKEIPVPPEYKSEVLNWFSKPQGRQPLEIELPASLPTYSVGSHVLMYGGLDGWTYAVSTCIDGVLERLRNLSERLAGEYGWQEAQATLFVLTGKVPFVDPIYVSHEMRSSPLYLRQRIILDVDPTVSPLEVTNHYRLARGRTIGRRSGKLSAKHLRLATFDAERPKGESWAKKLAAWNRTERPEWGYGSDRRRFAHDCLQARRHILGSAGRKFEI